MIKYSLTDIRKTVKRPISFIPVFLIDPIAVRILWLVSNFTNLIPSHVTFVGLVMGFISCFFIINENLLFACLFFEFYYILDCVDGKLARLINKTSNLGDTFDHFGDLILFTSLSMSYILLFEEKGLQFEYIFQIIIFIFLINFNNFASFFFKYKINNTSENNTANKNSFLYQIKDYVNSKGVYFRFDNTEAIHVMFFLGPLIFYYYPDYYSLVLTTANLILILSIFSMIIRNKNLFKT